MSSTYDRLVNTPALVTLSGDRVVTTSHTIAQHFGKRHADVMRAIENLKASLPPRYERTFALIQTKVDLGEGRSRIDPAYEVSRDGFTLLAMGFTGAKALQFKLAYIDAFNAMEARLRADLAPARVPTPIKRKEFRCRADLSMTKRDEKGMLINWYVEERKDNWHDGAFIGEQWLKEIVELANYNPKDAYNAIAFAGDRLFDFKGGGHEIGFMNMLAQYAVAGMTQNKGHLCLPFKTASMATRDPAAAIRYNVTRLK